MMSDGLKVKDCATRLRVLPSSRKAGFRKGGETLPCRQWHSGTGMMAAGFFLYRKSEEDDDNWIRAHQS